jgi:flagellin
MALSISSNQAASRAAEQLSKNNRLLQKAMNRLSTGRRITSPVDDPGSLAVSMKLEASISRLAGAQNNVQNALSFMEVQDGLLYTAGNIIGRMGELKGLSSQDPMKSDQDSASYNNEFKDLQMQLYDISQMTFNGVSLFANYTTKKGATEALFNAQSQDLTRDNTISIYTSTSGGAGAKISINKSLLLSALTFKTDKSLAGAETGGASNWSNVSATDKTGYTVSTPNVWVTLASETLDGAMNLDQISIGIFEVSLENMSFLRAQNGGTQSRLSFNIESLAQQKTNLSSALGRIVDSDLAVESSNLKKYSILSQASASVLAQANSSMDVALLLLR